MGGKVNLEALKISAWLRVFEESGKDIFEVIEWGIKVATWCHSEEFFARRDRISEILHSVPNPAQRLRLVRNVSDDSGDESEEEDDKKQGKQESHRQVWKEDDQKPEKEEIGLKEWKESVSMPTTVADSGCRCRVIKMKQAATANKLLGLPAVEEGTKVSGTACNDQKLKGKPTLMIVEGGAVRGKPRSDYFVPKTELKPVCMSDENVKLKMEAITRKLRQRYLEAGQAKKRKIQPHVEVEQAKKKRRIPVNLTVPGGFRRKYEFRTTAVHKNFLVHKIQ